MQVMLLDFMRESILPYIDDADKEIRQAAALACCRILERNASTNAAATHGASAAAAAAAAGLGLPTMDARANSIAAAGLAYPVQLQPMSPGVLNPAVQVGAMIGFGVAGQVGGSGGFGSTLKQIKVIEAVVGKLLMAAVADTSERVRRTVLEVRRDAGFYVLVVLKILERLCAETLACSKVDRVALGDVEYTLIKR